MHIYTSRCGASPQTFRDSAARATTLGGRAGRPLEYRSVRVRTPNYGSLAQRNATNFNLTYPSRTFFTHSSVYFYECAEGVVSLLHHGEVIVGFFDYIILCEPLTPTLLVHVLVSHSKTPSPLERVWLREIKRLGLRSLRSRSSVGMLLWYEPKALSTKLLWWERTYAFYSVRATV